MADRLDKIVSFIYSFATKLRYELFYWDLQDFYYIIQLIPTVNAIN